MKFIMSTVIIAVGLLFIIGGLFVPSFSTIIVNQTTTSTTVPAATIVPSSTSSSSPTIFASATSDTISITWDGKVGTGTLSTSGSTGSATITVLQGSTTVQTFSTTTAGWAFSDISGSVYFSMTYSATFTNPSQTSHPVYTFEFAGSYSGNGFSLTMDPATTYGEFPLQSITNVGNFWVQVGSNTPVEITSTTQSVTFNIPAGSSTATLNVWYVEDNGATQNMQYPYVTATAYFSGNTYTSSVNTTMTTTTTFTAPSGTSYTAYETSYTINIPQTFTIDGYLLGSSGQSTELMEMVGGTGLVSPISTSFTTAQIITVAIGSIIFIAGIGVAAKWHI